MNLNGRLDKVEKATRLTTIPTWDDIQAVMWPVCTMPTVQEIDAFERINNGVASQADKDIYQAWLDKNKAAYLPALDKHLPRWREYFESDEFADMRAQYGDDWWKSGEQNNISTRVEKHSAEIDALRGI